MGLTRRGAALRRVRPRGQGGRGGVLSPRTWRAQWESGPCGQGLSWEQMDI